MTNEEFRYTRDGFRAFINRFKADPAIWAFSLVFLGVLFSVINSVDLQGWSKHVQLKLPFLVIPLAFASIRLSVEQLFRLFYLFIGIAFMSAVGVSILYFSDMSYYNDLIGQGQSLPTPIQHVSYAIIMSYVVVSSFVLFLEDKTHPRLRWPVLIIGIFLFLFMHLLAVRSGLVTMYLGLLLLILKRIFIAKKYIQGAGCLLVCVAAPVIAYYCVPSFYNKVGYMIWDFTQMMDNKTVNYSDGGRLLSFKLGWDLFIAEPWLGTGLGDFKATCHNWYITNVDGYQGKLNFPHNQFLFSLASTGIFGFIIYQIGIWLPFFKAQMYRSSLALSLFVIVVTSFLVETQLERSAVICFFLYFVMIIYRARD